MPAGRPAKKFDLAQVESMARLGCSNEEIADILGISLGTLWNNKKRSKEFLDAYNRGRSTMKKSLRRLQWHAAKKGNTAMLIWLGKQFLGQRDMPEQIMDVDEEYRVKFELE